MNMSICNAKKIHIIGLQILILDTDGLQIRTIYGNHPNKGSHSSLFSKYALWAGITPENL